MCGQLPDSGWLDIHGACVLRFEGSNEQEGFEIFLNEYPQTFNEGELQRIRVIYRTQKNTGE